MVSYSSLYTGHKKFVHDRVNCSECGKEICNSFILAKHKKAVHGIIPENTIQCQKCPMFFKIETMLEKHIASKHKSDTKSALTKESDGSGTSTIWVGME